LLRCLAVSAMHRSDDFIPRQPPDDCVDVGELILDRGRPRKRPATDEFVPPRIAPYGRGVRRGDSISGRRGRGRLAVFALTLLALLLACALGVLLVVPLGWQDQAVLGALSITAAIVLSSLSRAPTVTMALMAMSLFATLRYGYWRVMQTWEGVTSAGHLHQWDVIFVFLLLGAEFYAFATLALGYFQTLRPLRRPAVALSGPPTQWPTVDVFIPTYNEPLDVVRATVLGALALEYPADRFKVFLLDDGRRREFREFAEQVGVVYVTRDNNAHAKAGNINAALTRTNGELLAIFDCDHVPTRSFLQMTLGWFMRDRRLGLVQTPHHFYSPDPFERNLEQFRKVPNEGALFHRLVQDGNDLWNASFFCGSCAVIRREALDEIDGIAVETVTEDAHTALRMQRRGWNTAYINVPQAAGLATESLSAHIGQRIRWARGMVQILRLENPLFGRGLTFAQRLCYFNATTHFLFAVPRLIFLTVPLTYLLFGVVNIYGYSLAVFTYAIPHLVLAHLTNNRIQRGFRSAFWNEIYEAVLAPYILLPTLLALISPRLGKFNVTAKGGVVERSYFDRRVAWPFIVLLGLNVAGLVAAYQRFVTDPAHHDTVIMNAIWTVYNIVILAVGASVARERLQRRREVRLNVRVPLTLVTGDGRAIAAISCELSGHGVTARCERPLCLPRHSPVTVILNCRGVPTEIGARIVSDATRRELHLVFPRLTTKQERALVDAMYSRPEAWLAWDDGRVGDSPLLSLSRVVWLSLRGLVVVFVGLFALPRASGHRAGKAGRHRKRTAAAAASSVLLATLWPIGVDAAQRHVEPSGSRPETVMFRDAYDLKEIAGQEVTTFHRDGGSLNYYFGVPVTKVISQATLGLRYTATLVVPGEATLELLLNGSRIETIAVMPGRDQPVEVTLPADLLTTDNVLTVRLEGRCRACVRARAPWLALDNRSRLAIAGTRLPLANDLSLLPIPFVDAASRRAWPLPVAFSSEPELDSLKAAALVASWFGVFSDVRGVRFPVSIGEIPTGNAIVLVRREPNIDARLSLPPQPRTLVAMRDNPSDPYGKLLVVAGDTAADLLRAAQTLVSDDVSRVRADVLPARDVTLRRRAQYDAPRWLATDRPAPIGLYTTADRMRLVGSGSINVYLRLPPDLFLSARQSVPLSLRFTYAGVAPRAQAAVHVRLNAQDVDTIRLDPSPTAVKREEIVRLPTGRFRPYTNTLTIDVDFGRISVPENVAQYAAIDRESTIDLRALPHSVVLPRLELVADAGYPFTSWPDLTGTAVVLSTQPTPGEYETVLNMVGFFGAQTGAPAGGLTIVTSDRVDEVRDKDLVVLGTAATQPLLLAWTDRMPLGFSRDGLLINTAADSDLWLHPKWPFRPDDRERLARLVSAGYTFDAVLEHFVSPFRPDRSVVAIVPGDDDGAVAASAFTSARTGPVYGGVAVARAARFESFLLGLTAYHAGRSDDYQRAFVLVLEHYWLIPLAVLVAALIIGVRVHLGVERVAARRLIAGRS
jgi:cellulose synthase (UDP-forming)/cellulose synthase operon protein B